MISKFITGLACLCLTDKPSEGYMLAEAVPRCFFSKYSRIWSHPYVLPLYSATNNNKLVRGGNKKGKKARPSVYGHCSVIPGIAQLKPAAQIPAAIAINSVL